MKELFSLSDHNNDITEKASIKILNYTIELFKRIKSTEPVFDELIGTGVLIEIKNNFYLITAGHIIEDHYNNDNIGLKFDNNFVTLGGNCIYTRDNNQNNVDIAFIKLDLLLKNEIQKENFFLKEKYILNSFKQINQPDYIACGFPITYAKIYNKEYNIHPYCYRAVPCDEYNYKIRNKNKNEFLLMNYNKKKVLDNNNKMIIGPDLNGMSGGGLWYIPAFSNFKKSYNFEDIDIFLIGINTDWLCKEHLIQATHIGVIIDKIKKSFNEII